jgi:hypothetical protein
VIASGDRVGDRLGHEPLAQMPLVCPAAQRHHLIRHGQRQLVDQQVAEEGVAAVPLTALVQRDQEQVGALQHHQPPRGVGAVQQRVA